MGAVAYKFVQYNVETIVHLSSLKKDKMRDGFVIETKPGNSTYLASFPFLPASLHELVFDSYASEEGGIWKKRKILVAETPKIEFVGENNHDFNCR